MKTRHHVLHLVLLVVFGAGLALAAGIHDLILMAGTTGSMMLFILLVLCGTGLAVTGINYSTAVGTTSMTQLRIQFLVLLVVLGLSLALAVILSTTRDPERPSAPAGAGMVPSTTTYTTILVSPKDRRGPSFAELYPDMVRNVDHALAQGKQFYAYSRPCQPDGKETPR